MRSKSSLHTYKYTPLDHEITEKLTHLDVPTAISQPPKNRNENRKLNEGRAFTTALNENGVNYKILDSIEKEVSDALNAFKNERKKQTSVISNMRNELKQLSNKPSIISKTRPMSPLNEISRNSITIRHNDLPRKLTENAYISARPQKSNEENDSNYLKELLISKERALANEVINTQKMRKELEEYKKKYEDLPDIEKIRQKIFDLIKNYNSDFLMDKKGSVIENINENIEILLTNLENLVHHLNTERENIEEKYAKLFELHNKLIEVNSKKKNSEKSIRENENERLKKELKKSNKIKLYFFLILY